VIYLAYFFSILIFGFGGFWLVARLAEANGRKQESLQSLRDAQTDVNKRVVDAVRAGDTVDTSAAKLREDDGYRRLD